MIHNALNTYYLTDTAVATLSCTDSDSTGNTLTYSISGDDTPPKFKIDSSGVIQTTTTALDYETKQVYALVVTAEDSPTAGSKKTGTVTVSVQVSVNVGQKADSKRGNPGICPAT